MLWVLLAAAAAPLQVARNAFQRGMIGEAGPWGATLVRFLFGLPFSLVLLTLAILLTPDARPNPDLRFFV
ncbi:MAG: EamA/RhaT family transporter, partial [Phenylobacterium sp.]|nr:EamA/RhaT family transporter [Phenylobacterium sp.]